MKTQHRFKERNKKIMESVRQGKSNVEIARKVKLSRQRIRQIAVEHGFLWKVKRLEIIACLKKGMSDEHIAAQCHASVQYVYTLRRDNNFPTRFSQKTAARNKKIINLLNKNIPAEKIAADVGTVRSNIYIIARKNGVFLRKKKSRVPRIKALLRKGFSARQIADRLNITPVAVYLVKQQMINE